MDDFYRTIFPCFGIVLALLPLIICLFLWLKIQTLRDRVHVLEVRLADTAREWWNWAQGMTAHVKTLAPAGAGVGAAPEPAHGTPKVAAQPAEPGVHPFVEAPAKPRPTEHLRERIDDLRHKPTTPFTPPPAQPPAATVPAAHPSPPQATPASATTKQPAANIPPTVQQPPLAAATTSFAHTATPPAASAKRKPGLEAYLGMKLFVVIGAIALALAAIFLVKIGIDNGVFTAGRRDLAMLLAGIGLICVSQWRRRHEGFWSQGMASAGIIVLFATFFAATMLHGFLAVPQGFIALAITTAAAVGLSLQDWSGGRGGPKGGFLIATLGLVGGFLTPVLIHGNTPNVPGLFGYLLLLHIGIVAATRLRGWSVLAALAMLGSSAWLILWLLFNPRGFDPANGPIYGIFMLASVFAVVLSTAGEPHRWNGGPIGLAARVLTWLAAAMSLVAACVLLGKSNYLNLEWGFFAMLVAGCFVLGRLRRSYEGMTWLACAAVAAMLFAWAGVDHAHLPAGDLPRLVGWVMGFGIGCTLAAYGCQWKSPVPLRWTMLTCCVGLSYAALAYVVIPQDPRGDAWAWLPLGATVLFSLLALPIFLRRSKIVTGEESLTWYALTILAFLFAAPPMANFHGGTLTALWAALLPLVVFAVWRLRVPGLLLGVLVLAFILAGRGLMLNTYFHINPDGYSLFWNPIVWTYGSIVLSFALSAWLVERLPDHPGRLLGAIPSPDAISALLQTGAITAGFLLLTFLVRWYFHNGKLDDVSFLLEERGTFAVTWLLLASALVWVGAFTQRAAMNICGYVAGGIGLFYAAGILILAGNPLLTGENVGTMRIFNDLLYVYGVPALLCGALAWVSSRGPRANAPFARIAGITSLALTFVLVTLEVRQGFIGGVLNAGTVSFMEWGTYSVAWMTLGLIALTIGMAVSRELLRRAGFFFTTGGLLYAIVAVGLFLNPIFHHQSVGTWPVLNHILFAYGTPLLLAMLASWLVLPGPRGAAKYFRHPGIDDGDPFAPAQFSRILRNGMAALGFILLTTEIRQFFQGEFLDGDTMFFVERATYPILWLALAGLLLVFAQRFLEPTARRAGMILTWLGLLSAVGICAVLFNPLIWHEQVGPVKVFNWLLYAYGIPAIAAGIIARAWFSSADPAKRTLAWAGGLCGLFLVFILVTLEVQHFFRGDHLALGAGPTGEMAAYSLAWAALGAIWLIAGIFTKSPLFRWASLVMMLLTIFKVFLLDLTGLSDIQRVLSLAGLGVSLMALAFIYNRFVFTKERSNVSEVNVLPDETKSDA